MVLKKYAPYFDEAVRFDLRSGTLDVRSGFRFGQGDGEAEFRLFGLGASVSDLRLRQREEKEEFLVLPEFAVKDAEVDPVRKEVTIGGIATAKGSVAVRRSADGAMNVTRLVPDDGRAVERGSRVMDRLVASGKVEPGRIFLVEPKTLPPERKEKLRDSRVDFRIR